MGFENETILAGNILYSLHVFFLFSPLECPDVFFPVLFSRPIHPYLHQVASSLIQNMSQEKVQ